MIDRSGAEWIKQTFQTEMSPLGGNVANLLDKVFKGIYHLDMGKLEKVDWGDPYVVSVQLYYQNLATFDNDYLTRLVVLAHDYCLRLDISAATIKTLELMFHQRQPTGNVSQQMPTMEQHLAAIRCYHPARPEPESEE